tara:strand:+ start:342 stop:500 length:159 start_codon:yes stop_codon:yes gene_type:complete
LEAEVRPEEWAKTPTAAGTVEHSQVIQVVMAAVQVEVQVFQVQAEVAEGPRQ